MQQNNTNLFCVHGATAWRAPTRMCSALIQLQSYTWRNKLIAGGFQQKEIFNQRKYLTVHNNKALSQIWFLCKIMLKYQYFSTWTQKLWMKFSLLNTNIALLLYSRSAIGPRTTGYTVALAKEEMGCQNDSYFAKKSIIVLILIHSYFVNPHDLFQSQIFHSTSQCDSKFWLVRVNEIKRDIYNLSKQDQNWMGLWI